MEYVSMLAGQAFTDAPRCTDPLLAELAWMVNDNIGAASRSSLVELAPRLLASPGRGPRTAPAIVAAAIDAASRVRPGRGDLRRHRLRALHVAAPASYAVWSEHVRSRLYRLGPARRALSCAVDVVTRYADSPAARDAALTRMLERTIAVVEDPARVRFAHA